MATALTELYRHHRWANLRLLDHCASLDLSLLAATSLGTYGRVDTTLWHIVGGEEGYVRHLGGQVREPTLYEIGEFTDIPDLKERAATNGDQLIAIADAAQPDEIITGTFRDQPYTMPKVVLLMQAINHATEHRAHIITTLSQHGIAPLDLDAFTYLQNGMAL